LPFEDAALPLQDILDAITAIEEFTRGITLDAFERDAKTAAAVERKLQVLSEAAIRLGDRAEVLCPGLPWPNIRGIGNWLRHEYHRVDSLTIWKTVTDGLPPLKDAVARALETPPGRLGSPERTDDGED